LHFLLVLLSVSNNTHERRQTFYNFSYTSKENPISCEEIFLVFRLSREHWVGRNKRRREYTQLFPPSSKNTSECDVSCADNLSWVKKASHTLPTSFPPVFCLLVRKTTLKHIIKNINLFARVFFHYEPGPRVARNLCEPSVFL
jgi:hypothetical protein